MKKVIVALFFLLPMVGFSQRPNGAGANREAKMQQIQTAKIGVLTEKLNLTPEQAPQFWAVYNEFDKKRMELMQGVRKLNEEASSLSSTDDKIVQTHRQILTNRRKMVDLEEEYMSKLLKVINARQYSELVKSENHFRRMLIDRANGGKGRN